MEMLITYPVYTPARTAVRMQPSSFSESDNSLGANHPAIGGYLAPARPRYVGELQSLDDDDYLDWGDGDGESGGTEIGDANGNHVGEAVPNGDMLAPMLLMMLLYLLVKRVNAIFR